MSPHDPPRRPESSAVLLARAGWLDLLDDIHAGLCHDLNSRVASVDGLLQILEMDRADAAQTLTYLGPEAVRLADMASRLQHLSGRVDAPPEAFEPAELLAAALPLLSRHPGLKGLDVRAAELPPVAPVRGSRSRLLRVLLLLTVAAGEAARAEGARGLGAELADVGADVELRLRWIAGNASRGTVAASCLPERLAGPLAGLVALDGGTLVADGSSLGFRLPALGRS